MLDVIPVINCPDRDTECVKARLAKSRELADWVHLDVADALFTFNKSWSDPEEWGKLDHRRDHEVSLEVHLMVEEPVPVAKAWLDAGAKRVIVHIETINQESLQTIVDEAKSHRAEVMLAISPETPTDAIAPYLKTVNLFQVLAVTPGPSEQYFLPIVLDKVRFLRREVPNAKIEVDGGINPETALLAKQAGANIVVSGTYIFKKHDHEAAYEELRNV